MNPQEYIEKIRRFPAELEVLVKPLSDEQLECREAPGEWSVRQIVHHLVDAHINGMVRLKLALTEDKPTVKTYAQAEWAELADYALPIDGSLAMIRALHEHFVVVFNSLSDEQWQRAWVRGNNTELMVSDIARIYADHGADHIEQIKRTLAAGLRK